MKRKYLLVIAVIFIIVIFVALILIEQYKVENTNNLNHKFAQAGKNNVENVINSTNKVVEIPNNEVDNENKVLQNETNQKNNAEQDEFANDVVIAHKNVKNLDKLNEFVDYFMKTNTVDLKEAKNIRIVTYTVEGAPIITTVTFEPNGYYKSKFTISVDYTRDRFSNEADRKVVTDEYLSQYYQLFRQYKQNNDEGYIEISLKENGIKKMDKEASICSYPLNCSPDNANYASNVYVKCEMKNTNNIIDITKNQNYPVHIMKGSATVKIKNKEYTLKEALEGKKISCDDILEQAEMDYENGFCIKVEDTDEKENINATTYKYGDYNLIKYNTKYGTKAVVFTGNKCLHSSEVWRELYSRTTIDVAM